MGGRIQTKENLLNTQEINSVNPSERSLGLQSRNKFTKNAQSLN